MLVVCWIQNLTYHFVKWNKIQLVTKYLFTTSHDYSSALNIYVCVQNKKTSIIIAYQGNVRDNGRKGSQVTWLDKCFDGTRFYRIEPKGQLISKCPYEKSVLSKIPTKKFPRFLS